MSQVSSQWIAVLYPEQICGDHFTAILCKWLKGQNTSVGIELIELTEPSDTLNYKSIIKNCFSRTILHVFLLFVFVWNKIFCPKNWAVFYLLLLLLLLWLLSFLLLLLLLLFIWVGIRYYSAKCSVFSGTLFIKTKGIRDSLTTVTKKRSPIHFSDTI